MGGRIFAVDQATGRIRWSMQTGDTLPRNVAPAGGWDLLVSSPVVVGNTVVIGGRDGVVYALDLASGAVRWRARTTGKVRATPAVHDGVVVVGSWDGRVYAFDLATGRERWVNRTVGDTLDSKKFGFDRRAIQGSAAIAGGQVFVGSRDGGLYGIDFKTGERQWRATHRGSWVVGSPTRRAGPRDRRELGRPLHSCGRTRDRQGHLAARDRHERARLAAPDRRPHGHRALSHRRTGWGTLGARRSDRRRAMEARPRRRHHVVAGGGRRRALRRHRGRQYRGHSGDQRRGAALRGVLRPGAHGSSRGPTAPSWRSSTSAAWATRCSPPIRWRGSSRPA